MLTLAIENMHCGGCLRSVERAALKVSGVQTARASLAAKRVSIVYDPGRAGAGDFIDALKGAGFAAAAIEAAKQNRDDARQNYLLLGARGGGGFCRHEHHADLDRGMVGRGERHGPGAGERLPLGLGPDRAAHGRLCRAALLRFGARRAEGPAPQHGCADLDDSAGDRDEPVPDAAGRPAGLFRCRRLASVLFTGRPLPRRDVARACPRRGAEFCSACKAAWPPSSSRAARTSRCWCMRFAPAIVCWWRRAKGLPPTAWCWKGPGRLIRVRLPAKRLR